MLVSFAFLLSICFSVIFIQRSNSSLALATIFAPFLENFSSDVVYSWCAEKVKAENPELLINWYQKISKI